MYWKRLSLYTSIGTGYDQEVKNLSAVTYDNLKERNGANTKFFELLEKYTLWGRRKFSHSSRDDLYKEFRSKWNEWVKDNEDKTLDFSNFMFNVNDDKLYLLEVIDVDGLYEFNFSRFYFCNVNFKGTKFKGIANFSSATFLGETAFSLATFLGTVNFSYAKFSKKVEFSNASFEEMVNFSHTNFEERIDYSNAKFVREVNFSYAKFSKSVIFSDASFKEMGNFSHVNFEERVDYRKVKFARESNFSDAKFSGQVDFSDIEFSEDEGSGRDTKYFNVSNTTFCSVFVFHCSKIPSPTDFSSTIFEKTPNIQHDKSWLENKKLNPSDESAYRFLKSYFKKQEDHEREWEYFKLEMECKKKNLKWWRIHKFWLRLYGWLSGYGTSYIRPLCGILIVFIIFLFSNIDLSNIECTNLSWECFRDTDLKIIKVFFIKSIFPLVGLNRVFGLKLYDVGISDIALVLYALFVIPLLFLFFLGIKNRFKLK